MEALRIEDFSRLMGKSSQTIGKMIAQEGYKTLKKGSKRFVPPEIARKILDRYKSVKKGHPEDPMVISLFNVKSQEGKTSIAIEIAEGMSRLGFKTLAIDLDPQAELTKSFMGKHFTPKNTLYDYINEDCEPDDIFIKIGPHLDLMPSSLKDAVINNVFSEERVYEFFFNVILEYYSNYDVVVIDYSPHMGHVTKPALVFTNLILSPITGEKYGTAGAEQTLRVLDVMFQKKAKYRQRPCHKFVLNKVDHTDISKIKGLLKKKYISENLYPVLISENEKLEKTLSQGGSVFDTKKPEHKSDLLSLISSLIRKEDGLDIIHSR